MTCCVVVGCGLWVAVLRYQYGGLVALDLLGRWDGPDRLTRLDCRLDQDIRLSDAIYSGRYVFPTFVWYIGFMTHM
jgi:hypothetical protein